MAARKSKKQRETEIEEQLVTKLNQRYKKSESAFGKHRQELAELDKLDQGKHWDGVQLPPWIPKPTHNMMRYLRILKRANLSSAIPAAHYKPVYPEHKEMIENIQRAYKHVWTTEKVPRVIRRCIDRIFLQGTAVAMVYTDDTFIDGIFYEKDDNRNKMFQGRIYVKRIPLATFYPDPDAYTLETCKYIDIPYNTSLSELKKNKQFIDFAGDKLRYYEASTVSTDPAESGEIYQRDVMIGQNGISVQGDDMITVHVHYERSYSEEKKRYVLNKYYYIGNATFLLYKEEDVMPNKYPFAILYDEEEENSIFGTGTGKDISEQQKVINKANQTASVVGTLHQNPQKIVSEESGINAKEMSQKGAMAGVTWKANGDPSRAVHVLQPPDIPRGLFEMKDRNIADIKESVGINEAYTGQSVGSLTTSTGVNSLIDRATIRDKDKMTQIDEFIEAVSDLIVLNIIYKWKESRDIVNVKHNGDIEPHTYTPIKKVDAANLRWFVKSDVYSTAPTSQARREEKAQQLLQLQGQFNYDPPLITVEEYMSMQDFSDREEIIQRMEADRARKEAKEATDIAGIIAQVAQAASEMQSQGQPPETIQQMMQEQAQQLLDQWDQASNMGRPRDAASSTQAPQGTTGVQAMSNMVQG